MTDVPTAQPSTPPVAGVPWNGWWGVLVAIGSFLASQLLAGIGISIYAAARHLPAAQLDQSVTASFLFVVAFAVCVLFLVRLFLTHYNVGFRTIGLRQPRIIDGLYGIAALAPYLVLFLGVAAVIQALVPGFNTNQSQDVGFNDVAGRAQLIMTFVSLVVVAPLTEEIIFRGLLYSSLRKVAPLAAAVVGTSALFAAGHLLESTSGQGLLYVAGLDTFILSLVLIFLRERTGGLWAGITLHAAKNGIAFVTLFVLHAK